MTIRLLSLLTSFLKFHETAQQLRGWPTVAKSRPGCKTINK